MTHNQEIGLIIAIAILFVGLAFYAGQLYESRRKIKWITSSYHLATPITATGKKHQYCFCIGGNTPNLDYRLRNSYIQYSGSVHPADNTGFLMRSGILLSFGFCSSHLQVRSFSFTGLTCTVIVRHINPSKPFTPSDFPVGMEVHYAEE